MCTLYTLLYVKLEEWICFGGRVLKIFNFLNVIGCYYYVYHVASCSSFTCTRVCSTVTLLNQSSYILLLWHLL